MLLDLLFSFEELSCQPFYLSLMGSSGSRFYGGWFCAAAVEVFVVFVDGLKGPVVSFVFAVHFALLFWLLSMQVELSAQVDVA